MKSGKCVKCGSTNVRRGPKPGPWGDGHGMIALGTAWGKKVAAVDYVCVACGYTEKYVVKPEDRETIRKRWKLATEPED